MNALYRRMNAAARREVTGWLFMLPMMLFFVTFLFYPIVKAIRMSLYAFDYTKYYWAGFDNYVDIFRNETFLLAIKNTVLFVVIIVPCVTIVALLLAVGINRLSHWKQSFFKAAFYIPGVTSAVSLTMVWEYIYNNQYGIANYTLKKMGIEPVNWLGAQYGVSSLSLIMITLALGGSLVVLSAGLNAIPKDLYESAYIDGAKPRDTFFRISLPLLKPSLLYVIVTGTIGAFQVFAIILLLTGGGPAYKTTTILMLIYREAFFNLNYGMANAMGIVLCVLIGLIALVQFRALKSDIEY
ncbi:carbohydrate ABC transporter permease [Paenibacillus cymbidii]|uniref:carbohydrate ABC transporter permease n=1 Tax=Paenibacillus cymbidii TaxID=1639034 RepID=UPI0010807D64|nr:sugar ABC transporter permease [Paenibacillus cymbidii]